MGREKPNYMTTEPVVDEKEIAASPPLDSCLSKSSNEAPVQDCKRDDYSVWLAVVGGFLLSSVSWGPSLSYGSFQDYYTTRLLPHHSASSISWIGTLNSFLVELVGVFSGPLFDQGYGRHLVLLGSFLMVFGMMMLSFAREYYQVILSHGMCQGIGAGLAFVPTIATVSTRVQGKKALALAITTCGGAIGGVLIPIIILRLRPQIGFPWAVRTLGFIQLGSVLAAFPLIFYKSPSIRRPTGRVIELSALKDPAFTVLALAHFLLYLAYYIPIAYIPTYAMEVLQQPRESGLYLLAGLNAASLPSRIGLAVLTSRFSPVSLLTTAAVASSVLLYCWISIKSLVGLAVFSVLFGMSSGAFLSLGSVVIAHPRITPSPEVAGARLGTQWFFSSLGSLIGAPIAGVLQNTRTNDFTGGQIFGGSTMAGAVLCLVVVTGWIWRYDRSMKCLEKA
ncbi:major facilitator superfamily domain-containing protein [Aspergillus ambiguus]|uniref:major facilitator superfamily domain-containing protein n=1 Tax=Aspergillus ambiguus TaxID=176160 RepID=UPI003CCCC474